MSYCAPGVKVNRADNTCFNINALRKIASAYNNNRARNARDMIKLNNSTKEYLWDQLRKKLSRECQTEWCWLDLDFVKSLNDPELLNYHRPAGPKKKNAWLSTTDINKVMKQYEKLYKGFVFLGPVPIDFAEINMELNNINLPSLIKKGIKSIGVVFNMDPHDQSGSHWVSMFIDLDKWVISYFDSFGICPPPQEIRNFIESINQSALQYRKKRMHVNCNQVQHQIRNTECGVYSIYFIVESLKGRTFNNISQKIILDNEIEKYRNLFFR